MLKGVSSIYWELFLIRCEVKGQGCRMCTDCKARWGEFVSCDIELYKINWIELSLFFNSLGRKCFKSPEPAAEGSGLWRGDSAAASACLFAFINTMDWVNLMGIKSVDLDLGQLWSVVRLVGRPRGDGTASCNGGCKHTVSIITF